MHSQQSSLRPRHDDDSTITGLFSKVAGRYGGMTAVVDRGRRTTYTVLDEVSNTWAAELVRRGVRPGDIVPVVLPRSAELVGALLAVLKAGAAYAVIPPDWPAQRRRSLVRQTGAGTVIGPAGSDALVPAVVWPHLEEAERSSAPPRPAGVTGESAATVFFTSGSTGEPKAVVSPHRATTRLLGDPVLAHLAPGSAMPQNAALPWDAFSLELWAMLLSGGTCVLVDGPYLLPATLRGMIAEHGVDTLWLTASLFNMFLDEDPGCFAGLTCVLTGGERLSPQHVRMFLAAHPGIRLINGYGPVESTVFATVHEIGPDDPDCRCGIPVGRPVAGTEIYVLADGEPCPPGRPGEIHIGGTGLAREYAGRPELTAAAFVTVELDGRPRRLYRTGDLGHRTADGLLHFDGREGRQVKLRGRRIEPGEIEAAFRRLDGVTDCAAVPRVDAAGTCHGITLFFTGPAGAEGAPDPRARFAAVVPGYLVPDEIVPVPRFPLTAHGKIDHRALAASRPGTPRSAPPAGPTPGTGSLRDTVTAVFGQVLGQTGVPGDVPFFSLGGTSLDAGRVCARLSVLLDRAVPASLLMAHPTADALADRLAAAPAPADASRARLPEPGPSGADRHVELSGMPAGFAMAHEFAPHDPAPVCLLLWRVDGPLDPDSLERSLRDLAERHQCLSASYQAIPRPIARPAPAGRRGPEHHRLDGTQDEAAGLRRLRACLSEPLAIDRGEVWRCASVPVDGRTLLGLAVHHIAFDAWSQQVLVEELGLAYEARRRGTAPDFPSTAPSLERIARAQRVRQAPEHLTAQRNFWVDSLAGLPDLSFHSPGVGTEGPAAVGDHDAGRWDFVLPAAEVRALDALAADGGTTRFVVLLTAWARALRAALGQEAFGVGVPIAQRDTPGMDRAVGCLINTLCVPFRNLDGTFPEAVGRTHSTVMRAFAAQDVPFPDVVAALRLGRSQRHPLFQTMFALQDIGERRLDLSGCRVEQVRAWAPRAMSELVAQVVPHEDGTLLAALEAQPDRVSDDVVRVVRHAFRTALADAAGGSRLHQSATTSR